MVMIKVDDISWYEDKTWLSNLDVFLDAIEDNDDLLLVFDGPERAGKSKRMRQVAKYCADYLGTEFSSKNIKFGVQDYIDFSIESPDKTVCVLDESRKELNRAKSTSRIAVKFNDYLSECAKKNQVHLIALPAYHDMNNYVINWRSKGVFHIHKWYEKDESRKSGYKLGRGEFTFYLNDAYLKKCYFFKYDYPKRWACKGRFKDVEVLTKEDLADYDKRKDDNIQLKYHSKSAEEELTKTQQQWKYRAMNLAEHCEVSRGIKQGEIADAMKMEIGNYRSQKNYIKN